MAAGRTPISRSFPFIGLVIPKSVASAKSGSPSGF